MAEHKDNDLDARLNDLARKRVRNNNMGPKTTKSGSKQQHQARNNNGGTQLCRMKNSDLDQNCTSAYHCNKTMACTVRAHAIRCRPNAHSEALTIVHACTTVDV